GQRTFWHWEASFATPPGRERELREMVARDVYEAGFENLRRHLRIGGDLHGGVTAATRSAAAQAMPRALPLPTRRAVVRRYGDPDVLQMEDAEAAVPGVGEVRIRQRAIGVNFLDVYLRRGWIPAMLPLPGVPGLEAAGTVLDIGDGVLDLLPGDRVAYLSAQPGAYCTVRTIAAEAVVRLPPQIEDETAAALLLKGISADYLLRDLGHVARGTRLLVHAAAGGLGLLLCAWASRLGADVVGTVSSEDKARLAREFGCAQVIVTREHRFAEAVRRHFGGSNPGADVIIDGLGDAARDENHAALARRGHWISIGQATGPLQPLSPDALVMKSATFSRPAVFDYVATNAQLAERAQRVWNALADGALKLPPIERHPLEGAARAHERLESRATMGPLILIA
ncbi:MAG TPA: quinone oxidoreductase, partial [Burkholderiaceae bacterium]|nr:quinone oxidoreductase [Burkholderiaceae bacterium]